MYGERLAEVEGEALGITSPSPVEEAEDPRERFSDGAEGDLER